MFGLFLVEAYVSKLTLNKNTYKDSGGAPLAVRVNFINFPPMEIVERKRDSKDESFFFEFKGGEFRHFSMPCEELASNMKKIPLRIGVFRAGENFPICYNFTHFSGCACNLASLSVDEPAQFTFKGPFDLIDPGENFAGEVGVDINLSNMGRFAITRYALAPGYFVFKNDSRTKSDHEGGEYSCSYKNGSPAELSRGGYGPFIGGDNSAVVGNNGMKSENGLTENFIRDVAGISLAAELLALGRPPPKPPRPPLEDPSQVRRKRQGRKKGGKKGKKKKK